MSGLFGDDPISATPPIRPGPKRGWYPAPNDPSKEALWDGRDWTGLRRTKAGATPKEQHAQLVCPHCQEKGGVKVTTVVRKKGISGGKATGALFTAGVSLFAVGLSRKEKAQHLHCQNCGMQWDVA